MRRTKTERPFVRVNFAVTADGKISTRRFSPTSFTSPRDKQRLLEIRARSDALLVGRNTVEIEDMVMGLPDPALRRARVRRGQTPYPVRVLVTNSGKLKKGLRILKGRDSPLLIYSTERMPPKSRAALEPHATLHLTKGSEVNLRKVLRHLTSKYDVKSITCEGGSTLFRALLELRLVDEINLTITPLLFGGLKAPTLTGLPGQFLPKSIRCTLDEMAQEGDDCFLRYTVA